MRNPKVKPRKKRKFSDKELLQFLWRFVTPHGKTLVYVSFFMILNIGFAIISPLIYQNTIDLIQLEIADSFNEILYGLIAYFLISIANWLSIVFRRIFTVTLNTAITKNMRVHAFGRLLENNLNFYHHSESGVLVSSITNDIQELNDTGERFIIVLISIVRLIITVIILIQFSVRLTLTSIIFLPVFFVIFILLRKFRRRVEKKWRKSFGDVNQSFSESMRSIAICKAFAQEEENIKEFTEKNEETYRNSIKRALGIFIIGPFNDLFKHILLVIILYLGSQLVADPTVDLTVGAFYLFVLMLDYFYYPILNLAYNMNRFQGVLGILDRLFDFCEQPTQKEIDEATKLIKDLQGKLEFRNVHFSYVKEQPVLSKINFKVEPGQRVALVGHTGVGKTTIASLLMRFYEINQGKILLDGTDIQNYSLESLRSKIGLVNQNVLLIKGTIRENLLLGNEDASDQAIWDALDAVQAREFIETLPNGLDSEVSENGKNLSAGQRQMISFARVLLGDPKLVILDEATSAVDLYTEAKIQDSTDLLLEGKTSIVIAHRLTTILKSDVIVVLEDGQVVQIGNHQQLMDQTGPYQEMYNLYFRTQSAKYLEEIKTKSA